MHEKACFLTLTYNDDNLPFSARDNKPTLRPEDLQRFCKRLRFHLDPVKIRFFACGEYGSKGERPHYHMVLYGYDFNEFLVWSNGVYHCSELEKLWPFGYVFVGEANEASIAYVAGYVSKKLIEMQEDLSDRVQPFVRASNRPGIGASWFEKYSSNMLAFCNGMKEIGKWSCKSGMTPPQSWVRKFDQLFPERSIKRREIFMALARDDCIDFAELARKEEFSNVLVSRSIMNRSFDK